VSSPVIIGIVSILLPFIVGTSFIKFTSFFLAHYAVSSISHSMSGTFCARLSFEKPMEHSVRAVCVNAHVRICAGAIRNGRPYRDS